MLLDYIVLWTVSIIFLASFVTTAFGFGFGLVVMPFLLFFYDVQTATPLTAGAGTILALFITIKLWRHIRMKTIKRLLISGLFGLPFGLAILVWVKNDILVIALGTVLIGFAVFQIASPQTVILKSDRLSYIADFFSGILGVAYNIPAPPLIIYAALRRWDPEAFKATLQGMFITLGILVNICHLSAGLWNVQLLKLLSVCLPFIIAGVAGGFWISRFIKQAAFQQYLNYVIIVLGGIIIFRTVMF